MELEEKLSAIEKLEPRNDWLTIALEKAIAPLYEEIEAAPEEYRDDFWGTVEIEKVLTPEKLKRYERIRMLLGRRYWQLCRRQEKIRQTLTIDECERMIIS
ncbi:hypothetical protein [Neisseria dumasiana]|uniref:Uncharacterized protein n=1 Tax=Neisseria dumasiana TaxID=1931275 RepID=A0A1X3DI65_9NEIS|nr:hypothetical protein [Neisseria dumasiana]OSI21678.1 hypothetical protein BV912_06410 [Neisseria dumasiana]